MDASKILKNLRLLGKISPYDAINKLKPLLMDLDDFKLDILASIKKIPAKTDAFELLKVLGEMEIIDNPEGKEDTLRLVFKIGTKPEIMDIIQKTIYDMSNQDDINSNNLLDCDITDIQGLIYDNEITCPLEKIPEKIKTLLKDYPDCYLRINGDLDLQRKKNFDDSCLPDIIVAGNFYASKKTKNFPFGVYGTAYCQGIDKKIITKDTFLPITETMDLSYSISDFSLLMDILLPRTLETLIVEPRFLREDYVKNNLELINEFMKKYPILTVLDIKGNKLSDVKEKIENSAVEKTPEKQPEKPIEQVKTIIFEQKKNGCDLTVMDLLKYCRTIHDNGVFKYAEFSDNDLRNLIKNAMKYTNLKTKKKVTNTDGNIIDSINFSEFSILVENLDNVIQEEKEQKTESVYEPEQKQNVVKQQSVKREPIKIKKYITLEQLKVIRKSSGEQNANSALCAINEINLDPLDMQFQGAVHIMKDGKETVSAMVKKESGCCLVQSIDSSNHDDTKRIIWNVADGPDSLIIVCAGFREHHNTKKANNIYKYLRSTAYKKRTYTQQELDSKGYIDIDTLTKIGKPNNGNSDDKIDLSFLDDNLLTQKKSEILVKKY